MAKNFDITGLEELQKKMSEFENATRKKVLRSIARKSLNIYNKQARMNAPVDEGDLKKSIGNESARSRNRDKIGIVAGPRRKEGKKYEVDGATVTKGELKGHHAHLVEFGTGPRPASKEGRTRAAKINGKTVMIDNTGSMPAQPFLRPALDATQNQIIQTYAEEMKKKIDEVVNGKKPKPIQVNND